DEVVLTGYSGNTPYTYAILGSNVLTDLNIQVRTTADYSFQPAGIAFRYTDPNNTYFVAFYGGDVYLDLISGGSRILLTNSRGLGVNTGDYWWLRWVMVVPLSLCMP